MASGRRCERVGTGVWPTRHKRSIRPSRRARGHRTLMSRVSARRTGGYQTARRQWLTVPWSARASAVTQRQEVSAWIARRRRIAPSRRHGGAPCSIGRVSRTDPTPTSSARQPMILGGPRIGRRIRVAARARARMAERAAVGNPRIRLAETHGPGRPRIAAVIASSTRHAPPIKTAWTHRPGARPDRGSAAAKPAYTERR